MKQRRAHVSWLIPCLLSKVFLMYFTSLSMTQPGRGGRGAKGLFHLRIQIDQWQEWQSQTQERCGLALVKILAPPQSPKLPMIELILFFLWITLIWYQEAGLRLEITMSAPGLALLLTELHSSFPRSLCESEIKHLFLFYEQINDHHLCSTMK